MQIRNWHKMATILVDRYSSQGFKFKKRGGKIMEKGYFMLRVTNINRATKILLHRSYRSDEALYSERTDEKLSLEIILLNLKA